MRCLFKVHKEKAGFWATGQWTTWVRLKQVLPQSPLDLAAAWPHGAEIPQGGLFVDAVHNNPRGAQLKARIIADALLKDLLK